MRIFISTGEPSGDQHAANLIRALRKRRRDIEFVGFGGPRMEAAGAKLLYPLVNLAVMWIISVIANIQIFIRLVLRADRFFRDERPDAVVLIDYPGFNWWVARRAKRRGIPVVYFVPPQLWAWAGWRVKKMRKYVDHVLCALPFETDWFRARGVAGAVEIGHPYFDELAEREVDAEFVADQRARDGRRVVILPGSRNKEVERNVPVFLRAAARLHRERPNVRFSVACLIEPHAERCRDLIASDPEYARLPIEIHVGRTPELIQAAEVAWAVSGSVSLELMAETVPTVIHYQVKRFDLFLAWVLLKVPYITLVNLIADREVMPEFLSAGDASGDLAAWATTWLDDETKRQATIAALAAIRDRVAIPGSTERAAAFLVDLLDPKPGLPLRGPHTPQAAVGETLDREEVSGTPDR